MAAQPAPVDATLGGDPRPPAAPIPAAAKWVLALLMAIHAWLLLGAAAPSTHVLSPLAPAVKGPTFDEYFYIAAGATYWRSGGDFAENREHPPLTKLLTAAPLAARSDFEVPEHYRDLLHPPQQIFYGHNGGDWARNLYLARLPVIAVALLLDLCMFLAAASLAAGGAAGAWAGLAGTGLLAFDPSCIAAAATANLDFPSAAFAFAALLAVRRALLLQTAGSAFLASLALGAAMLAKLTALLLVPALAAMALVAMLGRRSLKPLFLCVLIGLGAFSTFAAGYAFETKSIAHVSGHGKYLSKQKDEQGNPRVLTKAWLRGPVDALFGREHGVPLLTAIKGLDHTLSETGRIGHNGYLFGEATPLEQTPEGPRYVGWKHYYLAVIPQKLPLTSLLLVVAGAFLALAPRGLPSARAGSRWVAWLDRATLLVFPAVVLLQFSLSNAQLGIKYVLSALPPLFLAAGLLASRRTLHGWIAALAIGGALQASVRLHPDEAMFSSLLAGGADAGHRVACVGDDWGQDAPGLALFCKDLATTGAALASHPNDDDLERLRTTLAPFLEAHGRELLPPDPHDPVDWRRIARAARRAARLGVKYRYYGEGDPSAYGYDFEPLPPGPQTGVVAVHVTNLHREAFNPFLGNAPDLGWLERFDRTASEGAPMPGIFGFFVPGRWIAPHRPFASIGKAILLYDIEALK